MERWASATITMTFFLLKEAKRNLTYLFRKSLQPRNKEISQSVRFIRIMERQRNFFKASRTLRVVLSSLNVLASLELLISQRSVHQCSLNRSLRVERRIALAMLPKGHKSISVPLRISALDRTRLAVGAPSIRPYLLAQSLPPASTSSCIPNKF